MNKEKLNNAGVIPMPEMIKFDNEIVYFRECWEKDFFKKYRGFAISKKTLEQLDEDKKYVIKYNGKNVHWYVTSVKDFIESSFTYKNTLDDIQKILLVKQMQEVLR